MPWRAVDEAGALWARTPGVSSVGELAAPGLLGPVADELTKDRARRHVPRLEAHVAVEQLTEAARLDEPRIVPPNLEEAALGEELQHTWLVRERRVEDVIREREPREHVPLLSSPHRRPTGDRLLRAVAPRVSVANDAPEETEVGRRERREPVHRQRGGRVH